MRDLYPTKNGRLTGPLQTRLFGLFFFLLALVGIQASAQNYTVTNTSDGTGTNQLRGALQAADAAGGSHTINVAAGTYNLSLGEIVFGNRAQNITIVGAGSGSTIINMTSTNQDRIFLINPPGTISNVIVSISGIKFTGGRINLSSPDGDGPYGGGAILAGGPGNSLTVTSCIFENNTAPAGCGSGGAIRYNGGGTLSVGLCTFTSNTSQDANGGAISYFLENLSTVGNGSVSIINSTFSGNSVTASGGSGGAVSIAAQGAAAGATFSVMVNKNTFTSNLASGAGGVGGAIQINNSFASGNTATVNYNRFYNNTANNTASNALAMNSAQGSVDATNNWWGCNDGPASCADKAAIVGSGGTGTLGLSKWLQLKLSASPSSMCPNAAATVTASILSNSAGEAQTIGNLGMLVGLPISFVNPVLGTTSGAQTTIQSNGTATVTYTGSGTSGAGSLNAVIDNVSNTDATAKAAITLVPTGTWTGTVSSSWLNAANWNCSILPTATTNVTIPSGVPNMPVVDGAGAVANNVTINSGATLSFSGNNLLEVKGTINTTGTFNPANGSLKLSGATAQSLPAGTYYNLFIEGGGAKTLAGNVTVSNTLTITSGSILLGTNTLTLTATASIIGGSASSYIVTNSTGKLVQNGLGATGRSGLIVFPVGSATSYTPLAITNAGTTDNFDVRVIDNLYAKYTGETPNSAAETNNVVKKTWFINEAVAGGSNVTLYFQWNGSDEAPGFSRSQAHVGHYSASLGYWLKFPQTAASGSNPYVLSQAGITSFSPYGVGNNGSVLPLQLVSFTGQLIQQGVQLNWLTSQEVNVKKFIVERAIDNQPFSAVGERAAQNTAGDHNYTFADASLGTNWNTVQYRLQMVDVDGRTVQSAILQFTNKNRPSSVTVANPFSQSLSLKVEAARAGTGTVSLYDLNGKRLLQKALTIHNGANMIELNTSSISQGTYLLKVEWNGEVFTEKIIRLNK